MRALVSSAHRALLAERDLRAREFLLYCERCFDVSIFVYMYLIYCVCIYLCMYVCMYCMYVRIY